MRAKSLAFIRSVDQEARGSHCDPLYRGDHLRDLDDYLKRAVRSSTQRRNYQQQEQLPFLWRYNLRTKLPPTVFSDVTEYEANLNLTEAMEEDVKRAYLHFFTGYPSPEWLASIGGEFEPDAFVLMEHMRFLPSARRPCYVLPSFDDRNSTVIRLSITTVGHVEPPLDSRTSKELQQLRKSAAVQLATTFRPSTPTPGKSIVRRFNLHDINRFSSEQDITILYQQKNNTSWSLLVFYDCGTNETPDVILGRLPIYKDREFPLVPVLRQPKTCTAFPGPIEDAQATSMHSTASRLPAHYGKTLDPDLMLYDPFYALHELFIFSLQSELQFLNMMQELVASQVEAQGTARIDVVEHELRGTPLLADFYHSRDVLDQHIKRLKTLLQLISRRETLPMSMAADSRLKSVAEQARRDLLQHCNTLIEQAKGLTERCERGADLALNNTSLQLTERAFDHSRSIGKLTTVGTWIAVLFVPLSLVTSIFGMNFVQFGTGTLDLWVFAAVAIPVLAVSTLALLWRKVGSYVKRWLEVAPWLHGTANVVKDLFA